MGESFEKRQELPRFHKRAFAHNYRAPFIYHIIFKKREGCELFGVVRGDARISPGEPGCAHIEESALGSVIAKEILALQRRFPVFQIYQFMVMPDHVHILLRVKDWLEKHLDHYMEDLVKVIGNSYNRLKKQENRTVSSLGVSESNSYSGLKEGQNLSGNRLSESGSSSESRLEKSEITGEDIFQPGYCDKPLLLKRSLDGLFRYIRENPHRLAMRQQFPQFFQRSRKLTIGRKCYDAYGNLFLFRNPDKEAVKISRRFTPKEVADKRSAWLSSASEGTILVSPFISRAEKEIRTEAESLGGKIILITHEEFGERFKPAAHDFNLCSEGRLLIISLGLPAKTPLTREICNEMNTLASTISDRF